MRIFFWATIGLWFLVLPAEVARGNPYHGMVQQLAAQSFLRWQTASAVQGAQFQTGPSLRVKSSGGSRAQAAANQKALEEYLAKLIPAMKLSPEAAHLPQEHPVAVDEQKRWTRYYTQAKRQLRPGVAYRWSSNATGDSAVVTLTEEHVAALRDNFDVVMWYRNELDKLAADGQNLEAQQFQLFLDYVVGGLLEGLPAAPEIGMGSGTVAPPEWKLDERRLREQVVMAYRYLLAKYQIYPEYEQFAPADLALLNSLVNVALLMGAQIRPESFDTLAVELNSVGPTGAWKRPIADALQMLKTRSQQAMWLAGNPAAAGDPAPCIITIPPPKPQETPAAAPPEKPEDAAQRVEIIIRPK